MLWVCSARPQNEFTTEKVMEMDVHYDLEIVKRIRRM